MPPDFTDQSSSKANCSVPTALPQLPPPFVIRAIALLTHIRKALCTLMQRANHRVTTFIHHPQDLPILQTVSHLFLTRFLPGNSYFPFTAPAPKLPSISAFPNRLPANGQFSLEAQKMYSSSSQLFTCFPDRLFLSSGSLHSRKYFPTALS